MQISLLNSNFPEGTTISSIGVSQIVLDDNSTNTGALTAETFVFSQESTSSVATDVQVGYAVTQALESSYAEDGQLQHSVDKLEELLLESVKDEIYVKIVDRTNRTLELLKQLSTRILDKVQMLILLKLITTNAVNIVTSAGITTDTFTIHKQKIGMISDLGSYPTKLSTGSLLHQNLELHSMLKKEVVRMTKFIL